MTSKTSTTRCYVEEYTNENGKLSARLREKHTGRKVDLGFIANPADCQNLLQFLGAAKQNQQSMPEIFSKEGDTDCVIVSGDLDFDSPDEIRYIFNEKLSYLFR
jgi:hypothetical protein